MHVKCKKNTAETRRYAHKLYMFTFKRRQHLIDYRSLYDIVEIDIIHSLILEIFIKSVVIVDILFRHIDIPSPLLLFEPYPLP